MKRAISLTKMNFESSCYKTPQYVSWFKSFKADFKKFLNSKGITEIDISKPNHFDMSGFFRKGTQAYYFHVGDLRWYKSDMLIRTAKDFKDYTGGSNDSISLESEEKFKEQFEYKVL